MVDTALGALLMICNMVLLKVSVHSASPASPMEFGLGRLEQFAKIKTSDIVKTFFGGIFYASLAKPTCLSWLLRGTDELQYSPLVAKCKLIINNTYK